MWKDQEGERREGGREGGRVTHSIVKSLGRVLFRRSPCCSISFPVSLCTEANQSHAHTQSPMATVVTIGGCSYVHNSSSRLIAAV